MRSAPAIFCQEINSFRLQDEILGGIDDFLAQLSDYLETLLDKRGEHTILSPPVANPKKQEVVIYLNTEETQFYSMSKSRGILDSSRWEV